MKRPAKGKSGSDEKKQGMRWPGIAKDNPEYQ